MRVDLKNGHVILPERMTKNDCNNELSIKKLNSQKFVMVFNDENKKPPHLINIDFRCAPGYRPDNSNKVDGGKRKTGTVISCTPYKKPMKKNDKPVKCNNSGENKKILPDADDTGDDDNFDNAGSDNDANDYDDVEFLETEAQESDGDEQASDKEEEEQPDDDDVDE